LACSAVAATPSRGVTANPAVGYCTDLLVRAGATVMFSETTEVRDAIEQMTARATSPEIADAMAREMAWYDAYLGRGQADRSANTTPGNKAGGLSNIVEKAMGSIIKSWHRAYQRCVVARREAAAQRLALRGHSGQRLYLRYLATGRRHEPACIHHRPGTPYGLAEVPVIKVATRTDLARRWHDLMDVNAGRIADGEATIEDMGWESSA